MALFNILIFQELKNCPKNYYVDNWQLVIGSFTSCKRVVSSCKCYTLVKGWKFIHRPYISSMGNVLTSH